MSPPVLDKNEARVRRMFGQIAGSYDFLNHALSLNIDKRWRAKTVRLVPPDPADPAPILDCCTGTGDLALAYHRATNGAVPVVGADFCHEMLVRAVGKAAKANAAIPFVEADAQALPFADNFFQLVTVAFGLRNVTDTDKGLAEMVRVAKPGARVAVLEFSRPRNRVLGWGYGVYFRRVLPLIGQVVSRSRENAYNYLPRSVAAFPDYDALAARMRAAGLADVWFRPFTFGVATLYVGTKPRQTA